LGPAGKRNCVHVLYIKAWLLAAKPYRFGFE